MDQKNHGNKELPKPPKEVDFHGKQLDLFQDFLCNTDRGKDSLSNTVELWDAVPKYHISRRQQNKLRTKEGFLPTADHDFVYRGKDFTVQIMPALLKVDGKDKAFYPSAREELVEDALRKLACKKGNGYFETERSGVAFTLNELRKELKKRGHTFSYYQVVESLKILKMTSVEISSLDGRFEHITSPSNNLVRVNREDLANDPKARWYADFSLLVTEGIKKIKYRQYDYALMMSHTHQLTRYLHKRLAHNYIQAGILKPYNISMTAIIRDSGLLQSYETRIKRVKIEEALNELVEAKILVRFETVKSRGLRNALIDIKYSLMPHPNFIADVKRANKRLQMAEVVVLSNRSSKTW